MIKKAKIIMKNGTSIDVGVNSINDFNVLADNINACNSFFKVNDSCRINCDDISLMSFIEEENNEQKS